MAKELLTVRMSYPSSSKFMANDYLKDPSLVRGGLGP